jgi:transposase-like protein
MVGGMKTESTSENEFPATLQQLIKYFADEAVTFEYMKRVRWPDGVVTCSHCGSARHSFISTRCIWKCLDCRKQFTIRLGTIFEDSPIKFDKWIAATWLIANTKNGISSYKLARDIEVCQKTGWFMLQRIRMAMQGGSILKDKLKGIIEVDESWIGGSARNMHKHKKAKVMKGCQNTALTPVQGLLERGVRKGESKVMLKLIDGTKRPELQANVRKYVLKGAEVHTDAHNSYRGLCDEYTHETVDHAVSYVRGNVHTNGLENFWSLLKRTIRGTYVNVEPFHLFRYLAEQAFRFNERKDDDQGRFLKVMSAIVGKRLTWAKLTGDADGLPGTA